MKLVLVQPSWRVNSLWEDLGSGYLAAYVSSQGLDVEIKHFSGAFDSDEAIVDGCLDADFVGFGCTSPQMKSARILAWRIKRENPRVKTIFGGYHPSALPVETGSYPEVDYVIVGEGEDGLLRLLKGLAENKIINSYPIDIELLPFPDREIIRNYRHVDFTEKADGKRITSIQSARGCPFYCRMCANSVIHSRLIRERSAENVMDEFERITEMLKLDFVKFRDASWNSSKAKVREFCVEKIRRRNDTAWGANIHVSLIDRELLELMRRAGCAEVWMGVESGSQNILNLMRKGLNVNRVREIFKVTKELGFIRRAYFMLGYPDETLEDIALTEKLVDEIEPDKVGFSICVPFPGSALYQPEYAGTDWSAVDEYGNKIWGTKTVANEDLRLIQKRLVKKFDGRIAGRRGIAGE